AREGEREFEEGYERGRVCQLRPTGAAHCAAPVPWFCESYPRPPLYYNFFSGTRSAGCGQPGRRTNAWPKAAFVGRLAAAPCWKAVGPTARPGHEPLPRAPEGIDPETSESSPRRHVSKGGLQ